MTSPYDCGKRGYDSKGDAKLARRRSGHRETRPYRCPDCDYWHLGHLGQTVIGGFMSRDERFRTGELARRVA